MDDFLSFAVRNRRSSLAELYKKFDPCLGAVKDNDQLIKFEENVLVIKRSV